MLFADTEKIKKIKIKGIKKDTSCGADVFSDLWVKDNITQVRKTKPTKLVSVPHPGASYNPSLQSYQALLNDVIEKEEKMVKKEESLQREVNNKLKKMSVNAIDIIKERELSEGLPIGKKYLLKREIECAENKEETSDPKKARKQKIGVKKKRTQKKLAQTMHIKKLLDIAKINSLKNEIDSEEKALKKKKESKRNKNAITKLNPKRLCRLKFNEKEIEINELNDISDSMLKIKPEGNLLFENFQEFQRRNQIPVTVLRKRNKCSKTKSYNKRGYVNKD